MTVSRRGRHVTACAFSLLLFVVAAYAQSSDQRVPPANTTPRLVRIASEGARPPFNYLDQNNELAGFEIDLGRELCRRMAVTCKFVMQDWDGMIPGLEAKHYDAIMAAMDITDDRLQQIDFSEPYVRMPPAFLATRGSDLHDPSPKGLAGRTIGVEQGSPEAAFLDAVYKKSEIKTYGELEDAILDLAADRIDTVLGDKDAIVDFLKTRREAVCCKLMQDIKRDPAFFGAGIGVGLRQGDEDLKALFNKAIEATFADGTYDKIREKYFDFEIY
jgi:polar amino acid transport system substrate-binding protein